MARREQDYGEFLKKFENKKTTDDCFTPPIVYDAVCGWVCERYGVSRSDFVRPFMPGGDFERFEYPEGCIVVDNPPFSILARIKEFYLERGIRFFLFCPSLTALSSRRIMKRLTHVICDARVTYENGAVVHTSFVTNMDEPGLVAYSCPELSRRVNEADEMNQAASRLEIPKYHYPDNVATAAMLRRYAKHGVEFRVYADECEPIGALDSQAAAGKGIYGGGLLLSERAADERAAAERAAAERAAATRWPLSERERAIIAELGAV